MPKMILDDTPKRIQPIIFIISNSGNMIGSRCKELNIALHKVLRTITREYSAHSDCKAKVAIMTYNTDVKWISSPKLVNPDEIDWADIVPFGGSYMGSAMISLDNNLSRKKLLFTINGIVPPIIVWITSSGCSGFDTLNYKRGKQGLLHNKWFTFSKKIGINYSDEDYPAYILRDALKIDVIQCKNCEKIYNTIIHALKLATFNVNVGNSKVIYSIDEYSNEEIVDSLDTDSPTFEEWSAEEW